MHRSPQSAIHINPEIPRAGTVMLALDGLSIEMDATKRTLRARLPNGTVVAIRPHCDHEDTVAAAEATRLSYLLDKNDTREVDLLDFLSRWRTESPGGETRLARVPSSMSSDFPRRLPSTSGHGMTLWRDFAAATRLASRPLKSF